MGADRLEAGRAAEPVVGEGANGAEGAGRGARASTGPSAGGRGAVERLFAHLLPVLARWAHGRLARHARRRCDTEDLIQDACSGAITHLPDLDARDPAQVDIYLRQSIRNRIRDEVRRARIGETASSEGLSIVDSRPGPLEEALESDERRRFRAALLALDPDDQQLVVGRVELKLGYEALARATGRESEEATRCAVRRAMFRLARGIAALEKREKLARLGGDDTAPAL